MVMIPNKNENKIPAIKTLLLTIVVSPLSIVGSLKIIEPKIIGSDNKNEYLEA